MEITDYFTELKEWRSAKALSVHKLVLELFPKSKVSFKYIMPTYESENGWVAIVNQNNYWFIPVGLKNSQNVWLLILT